MRRKTRMSASVSTKIFMSKRSRTRGSTKTRMPSTMTTAEASMRRERSRRLWVLKS
jgi:hypothetical protein